MIKIQVEIKNWFSEKVNEIDKTFIQTHQEKKTEINKLRNKRSITADSTKMQG